MSSGSRKNIVIKSGLSSRGKSLHKRGKGYGSRLSGRYRYKIDVILDEEGLTKEQVARKARLSVSGLYRVLGKSKNVPCSKIEKILGAVNILSSKKYTWKEIKGYDPPEPPLL